MLFSNRVNSWLKDRKERTEINIQQWVHLEEKDFLAVEMFLFASVLSNDP
jgi:hypothetical protein